MRKISAHFLFSGASRCLSPQSPQSRQWRRPTSLVALCALLWLNAGVPDAATAGLESASQRLTTLRVRDLTMAEFAALLSHSGVMQVVASKAAADEKVSLYLRNVTARDALEAVCRSRGLWMRDLGGDILQVIRQDEIVVSQHFYNDGFVELVSILYPPVSDIGKTIHNLFADRVVWIEPEDRMGDAHDAIQRALQRMDQLAQRSGFNLSSSGGSGSSATGSAQNDRAQSGNGFDAGRRSQLQQLPEPQRQAPGMGGTELAERNADDQQRQHGLVFVAAMPATNTLLLRSSDQKALSQIRQLVRDLDRPTPQVLLEVKVLSLDLDDGQESGIDWLFSNRSSENSGGFTSGLIQGTTSVNIDSMLELGQKIQQYNQLSRDAAGNVIIPGLDMLSIGDFSPPLSLRGSGFNANALIFNHITDRVNARIRLLQQQGRLTTLATPTLLVADNEASRVFIGTERQFIRGVDPAQQIATNAATGDPIFSEPTPRLESRPVGNTLLITPKIHADRTVTIRLLQEDSRLGATRSESFGGRSFPLEDVQRSSIVTTAVAKDGNLLAIGGLIRESSGESVRGIPLLMHIPLLGHLFKHATTTVRRNELIILIRPVILLAPGESTTATRSFLDRLSQHPHAADDSDGKQVESRR